LGTIVNGLSTYERQAWIGLDRPGRVESHVVGAPTFLSAAARQQWIRGGRPRELPGYNGSLLPNAFIRPYAAAGLPTNVDALWQLLYRETGNGGAAWKRRAARAGPQGVSARLVRYSPGPAASSSISAASRSSRSGASSCSAGGSEA
jgi:hypothetical protein